jgi:hypothetical protein
MQGQLIESLSRELISIALLHGLFRLRLWTTDALAKNNRGDI